MSIIGSKLEGNVNTPFGEQSNKCHHFFTYRLPIVFSMMRIKKCKICLCRNIRPSLQSIQIRIQYSHCNYDFNDLLTSYRYIYKYIGAHVLILANALNFLCGFSLLDTFMVLMVLAHHFYKSISIPECNMNHKIGFTA